MTETILEIKELSFAYGKRTVVRGMNFSLAKGEIATIIGGSGSGKTTLFKLLAGMLQPQQGCITIAGQPVALGHAQTAYMMQEDLLLPWRTVLRNMTLSAELGTNPHYSPSLLDEARQLLAEIGMPGCEEMYPHQLSGGMRQRVSLARALLQRKPILLLDEPFGPLDVSLREQMYALLRQLQTKYNTTILLVTHDFRDALSLSDRILLFAHGTIQQEWPITHSLRQSPLASAELMKAMQNELIH